MATVTGRQYDAIVIGAGHNGLTAAAFLARAGRRVIVLEQREVIGGLAAREEFHDGFRSPGALHETALFDSFVIEQLGLARHGLTLAESPQSVFVPHHDGPGLLIHHDPEKARAEIAAHSARDADRYGEYRTFIARVQPFIRRLLCRIPPDVAAPGWTSSLALASTGLALRRLGRRDMMEILRIGPMCVADWLNEWFETSALKCALAAPALDGSNAGPWSPGTNAMLLRHEALANHAARGGPGAIVAALEGACRGLGVELRTGAAVHRIDVERSAATGVTLAGGETISATHVAASCDPRRTFLDLLERRHVPDGLDRRIGHLRANGAAARINLALSGPLRFACRPELVVERARIADSFDDMERAFDPIKYHRAAPSPILDVFVPSIGDPTLAPDGHHVVSLLAHSAPRELEGGWTDDARAAFADRALDRLAAHAPDVRALIVARQVLTPADLEARYGVAGGHLHHVEHGLDQMIARPDPACARYATPIAGLYLCGSGSHPGGGITGLPGRLAAAAMLKS